MDNKISCYLCKSNSYSERYGKVRDSENIKVLECNNCGLVFLSSFDHINDQFYKESGMVGGNVDITKYRNNSFSDDIRRANFLAERISNKSLLDFGCGAGGLIHLVKKKCNIIAGIELDKKLNEILNKEGITCYENINSLNGKFDYITLFHVLEHLPNPLEVLEQLKEHLNPGGKIILEVPNSDDALLTLYNNEAFSNFTYWSCHLFLFNSSTLSNLIKQSSYKINYIKQIQRYPLSNHLYWLSKDLPSGHKEWSFLNSTFLQTEYENQLAAIGKCDTLLAEISV